MVSVLSKMLQKKKKQSAPYVPQIAVTGSLGFPVEKIVTSLVNIVQGIELCVPLTLLFELLLNSASFSDPKMSQQGT
jgi:hypothetical protein